MPSLKLTFIGVYWLSSTVNKVLFCFVVNKVDTVKLRWVPRGVLGNIQQVNLIFCWCEVRAMRDRATYGQGARNVIWRHFRRLLFLVPILLLRFLGRDAFPIMTDRGSERLVDWNDRVGRRGRFFGFIPALILTPAQHFWSVNISGTKIRLDGTKTISMTSGLCMVKSWSQICFPTTCALRPNPS